MEELIISYLLKGFTQIEISNELKSLGFKPNGLSTIEKELKRIRVKHNAKTMFHLGIILSKKRK